MVFEQYSAYYDRIYRDKNYREECAFLKDIFDTRGEKTVRTILDVGCGTGSHTVLLAEIGYEVTGVDLSDKMLRIAVKKAEEQNKKIEFLKGDIRRLDIPGRYDAVIAMFNVMGYLTTNQDIDNALKSINKHLNPGGLFVWDAWFGPAVLNEKPGEREKLLEERQGGFIKRYARPVLDLLNQTVEVNYTISETKDNREIKQVKESHLVRFYFYQEILYFMENNGFQTLKICPFLDKDGVIDDRCWNISVICKKPG
jgi:ubiquinone/menaquinone biosynthesis C-methylase UbiE